MFWDIWEKEVIINKMRVGDFPPKD
jgi:hypothetical protein